MGQWPRAPPGGGGPDTTIVKAMLCLGSGGPGAPPESTPHPSQYTALHVARWGKPIAMPPPPTAKLRHWRVRLGSPVPVVSRVTVSLGLNAKKEDSQKRGELGFLLIGGTGQCVTLAPARRTPGNPVGGGGVQTLSPKAEKFRPTITFGDKGIVPCAVRHGQVG